MINISRPCKN